MPDQFLEAMLGDGAVDIPSSHFLTGEVTDSTTWPPEIQAGASTDAVPTPTVGSYLPTDGDFVGVVSAGATRLCVGPITKGVGCRLRRVANQSATGSASTTVSWDTEDQDLGGFWTSGTDITIPTDCDGVYAIWARVAGAGAWGNASDLQIRVAAVATARQFLGITGVTRISASSTSYLVSGNVIDVIVTSTGATQNMTATLNVIRVA